MRIELISKEQFNIISDIQKEFPVLTFQNDGYQYIKEVLNNDEEKARMDVAKILGKHVRGFSSFTNFRISKNNELQIRLQYNYNWDAGLPFTGVGYILLDELLNGFK